MDSVFLEIASILLLATFFGILGLALRQPLIVAFLITGIMAGPSGFGIIRAHDKIDLLAQIGISLLLFVVGLRLDLNLIRTTGPVALATGLGQIIFTTIFGFFISLGFGLSTVGALYVAVALTFSSTIIIVKLLSDKREIDSLHGRIAMGFLIVQDIVAILALISLTALAGGTMEQQEALWEIAWIAGKGLGFLLGIGLLMKFVLPRLTHMLARNNELLILFAVAWAVFLGALGDFLGFSKEVGAFLGGVSLASTQYREAIGARLVSLRDFLLLFFFLDLGARLELTSVGSQMGKAAVLSLFVLVGNPIIVMIIMGIMGYRRRTGFLAGLTVAQISEFSLILGALGLSMGHISSETMGIITLVGIVTIFVSTYMILNSAQLYQVLSGLLRVFEKRYPHRERDIGTQCVLPEIDVIVIGLGNYGYGLTEHLLERNRRIMGVDFDPQVLKRVQALGVEDLFGDVGDPELMEHLPLNCTRWVLSTIRDRTLNLDLFHRLKDRGFEGKVALTARTEEDAQAYRDAGAHVVLRPYRDAAEQGADSLSEAMFLLPADVDWPLTVQEIRLRPGSVFSGSDIRSLPLRQKTGLSILAVRRAGRIYYDPGPEFTLYPGDHLVMMGDPVDLGHAEVILHEIEDAGEMNPLDNFTMAEIEVGAASPHAGKTLADLRFRQDYGATVVGILRGDLRISSPGLAETLKTGDRLIIIGTLEAIENLKKMSPI
ncbi:MAG: cation:proton antiporter [Desulfomonilia bacterium]